jgi:hypothetical protein
MPPVIICALQPVTSPTLRSVRCSSELSGRTPGEYLKRGFEDQVMPERRKISEAEDSDFGGGAQVPWKCVLPLKWVPRVPRIWERETTDPKPTEADHDRSR